MTDNGVGKRCPCGSKQFFEQCCQLVIDDPRGAAVPEQLMRARYSAYALGSYGQFLYDSWHETARASVSVAALDTLGNQWHRLRLLQSDTDAGNPDRGWVTFMAFFTVDGQPEVMHERSEFLREQGVWYYASGVQFDTQIPSRKSPCLCGSGKPFKRCCGDV